MDQRRSERHPAHVRIVYDDGASYNVGWVRNVSESGLLLECADALSPGAIIRLEPIEAEEDALFELSARVVRCTPLTGAGPAWAVGLEMIDLDDERRFELKRMIAGIDAERARPRIRDPYLG